VKCLHRPCGPDRRDRCGSGRPSRYRCCRAPTSTAVVAAPGRVERNVIETVDIFTTRDNHLEAARRLPSPRRPARAHQHRPDSTGAPHGRRHSAATLDVGGPLGLMLGTGLLLIGGQRPAADPAVPGSEGFICTAPTCGSATAPIDGAASSSVGEDLHVSVAARRTFGD
jgi:hypothetical protein